METGKNTLSQNIGLENKPKHDFRKIFLEKLEAIESIPEQDREDQASGFESIGIKKLKKEIPALLLRNSPLDEESEQKLDLWITDPKNIDSKYQHQSHDDVRQDLAKFLGVEEDDFRALRYPLGAQILQDEDGFLYLLVDEMRAEGINKYIKDEQKSSLLLNLLQRYGIKKIAGRFWRTRQEGDSTISGGETETIFDEDLIGERREDLQLLNIALKYHMTNTQFMRFRIRAKSGINATKKGEYKESLEPLEEIAKEVIGEGEE